MSDKMVMYVPKPTKGRTGTHPILRVSAQAISHVEDLAKRTGQPLSVIASELIEFAYERTEIRYMEHDESDGPNGESGEYDEPV